MSMMTEQGSRYHWTSWGLMPSPSTSSGAIRWGGPRDGHLVRVPFAEAGRLKEWSCLDARDGQRETSRYRGTSWGFMFSRLGFHVFPSLLRGLPMTRPLRVCHGAGLLSGFHIFPLGVSCFPLTVEWAAPGLGHTERPRRRPTY